MCAGGCKYRKFCCSCLAKKKQPVDMWNTWIILNFNQLRMLEMRSLSFFLFLVLIEQKHLEFWITSLPNLRVYWPMLVCSWHEYDHVHFLSHTCDGGHVGEKSALGFLTSRSYFPGVTIRIFENTHTWVIDWNGSEWKTPNFLCWLFIYSEKLIFPGN